MSHKPEKTDSWIPRRHQKNYDEYQKRVKTPLEGIHSDDDVPFDAAGIEALTKRKEFEEGREEEDKAEGSSKEKELEF